MAKEVVVLMKKLHLRLAWQGPTARSHRQRCATTVKLENQVHKERRNVEHGMCCDIVFYFSSCS